MINKRFICFESSDCFGKTTTAQKLVDSLNTMGYSAVYVQNPGHTMFGTCVRQIVKSNPDITNVERALLFYAVHYNLYTQVIKPHLDSDPKNIIVLDRYLVSTYFYNIQPKPTDWIVDTFLSDQWFKHAEALPDLTVFIDLPWETYKNRRTKRGDDKTDVLELDMKNSWDMNRKMLDYPLLYSKDALILNDGDATVDDNAKKILAYINKM